VIGSFDSSRGGTYSISSGSLTSNLRAHVAATFPGTTYSSSSTLTPAFLSGVNVLVIAAPFNNTGPAITPLSAAEQSALVSFVNAGGRALLFADNNTQFEVASDSMVSPFGLDSTGVIFGSATATVTNTMHPVTNGPFGPVSTLTYGSPGWFNALGANAAALARLNANNQVSLAVTDYGVLSPGSGAVVYFADATIDNSTYTGSIVTLVDNALAYTTVPEPGSLLLGGVGAAGLAVWRRRRIN
jgi:hypothetical protein